MWDLSQLQAHFNCPQCTKQHGFIEITQVCDSKLLSAEPSQAGTQRDIEVFQHHLAEFIRVMSLRE